VNHPLVSLVVLNWNGAVLVMECIESLKRLKYENTEIVVVDNASDDGSLPVLRRTEGIRLIANEKNLGYAAGGNAGFAAARGKYVALVNNDVVVEPSWLGEAVAFLERDESAGMVSCRQMNYFERDRIDALFAYLHPSMVFYQEAFGRKFSARRSYSVPSRVFGVSGASAVYRKKMLDEMRGFDESYGSYHEESDLCMRAFLRGWNCVYVPTAVAFHRRSASFNRVKGKGFYYLTRNRIWFIYKYTPLSLLLANLFWVLFTELRTLRVVTIKERVFGSYMKGLYDGFRTMPGYANIRKQNLALLESRKKEYTLLRKQKRLPYVGYTTPVPR
jgi:GT2 family glycosyltransferase